MRLRLVITIVVAALLAGCGANTTPASGSPGSESKSVEPTLDATLVAAQGADPQSFDPTQFANANHSFLHQLYDTLVDLGPDGNPVPAIAESWERSTDGLTVTFHLRKATFHSGRPLTAADVVFTLDRYLDESVGANLFERLETFERVEAQGDQTVVIHLSSQTPGLFDLLSAVFIQDRDRVDDLSSTDAGSGPFSLTEWKPGESFTMTRFDGHWRLPHPSLADIVVRVIPDPNAAAAALQTGEVQLLLTTNPLIARDLEAVDNITVLRPEVAPDTVYVSLNVTKGLLADKAVRQAIAMTIDRARITEIAFPGAGVPGCQPWAPGHWANDPSLDTQCKYDLEAARALLAQAGVTTGKLSANTSADAYSPGSIEAAQILKEDLAGLGIELEIQTYEPAQQRERLLASDFELLFHHYSEGGSDPQFVMPSGLFGPGEGSRSKFTSPEYERLVGEANGTTDVATRKGLYSQISALIIDEAFLIPIAYVYRQYAMSDRVAGVALEVNGFPVLYNVSIGQ